VIERLSAEQFVALVLDPESFVRWDDPVVPSPNLDADYDAELLRARAKTGLDESVVTGEGRLAGRRVAVIVCEFGFLAGSIGVAAASRLVRSIERATNERLPLVAAPTSGGTRMQEGTTAFVQMIKISVAVVQHRSAGLPYLVYIRNPTTGGVFASWGSLGHVTAAEPGALIGFLGPRVYEALHGEPFPVGVQVAENLFHRGIIDAVIPVDQLAAVASRALEVLAYDRTAIRSLPQVEDEEIPDIPAWDSIRRSRQPDRPGIQELMKYAGSKITPLEGTGQGEMEPGLFCALAKFGQAPCIVLGHDRRVESLGPMGPAGLREARRGFAMAKELGIPIVTVIDTAGLALSKDAEEGGLAGEIARCLGELVMLPTPTVSLILGQGSGGGALALLPADRVLSTQHGWLSPLPPEGASAIMHRTMERAPEMAQSQGVRSLDLRRAGIVDRIIAEGTDATSAPKVFMKNLGSVLEQEISALLLADPDVRFQKRIDRYRQLGVH
jgi:acyl-CoA carboxylase subunit beta